MLTGIQLINVPVSDQQRAYDFYVGTLGLAVIADQDGGPHGRWLQVAPAGSATALALTPAEADSPAGSVQGLVFETDDIDSEAARLAQAGIEAGIEDMPWARALRFSDPDGNGVVLQTALTAPS